MCSQRLKNRFLPEPYPQNAPIVTSAPFLLLLFRQDGKEGAAGGASETTTAEGAAASDVCFLCARFFLSKPQTEFAVWVFFMQICYNLSVSASPSQHPYPFCPFGTFPPDRGNRPLEGEPRGAHRRRYSELSGAPFSCRKSTIPWPGNGFSFCTIASLH